MSLPDLKQLIEGSRDEIVARFVTEVERKQLSPDGLAHPLLIDHIPTFLDEIAAQLNQLTGVRFSNDAVDTSLTARQHGEQRWTLGYDLDAVIREYGLLRHCILDTAKTLGAQLSIDEFDVIAKCLSVGVAEAATEYAKQRDEQLNLQKANLEFLAEAGQLLSSSLDPRSTLRRLTGLLVPRMADWCAVHVEGQSVEDMPILHVDPAKVEVIRDIYRRYPQASGSPDGYGQVVRTGDPLLVPEVNPALLETVAKNPEHLALLRTVNTCSWMIVPFYIQGAMLGAMTLAFSESARHYSDSDLALATEVARRAAVALDNARLYELSQKERSRVEAATRAKDEFVAVVSHELRTPLNAMLGWMRLIRGGSLSEAKHAHAFDVIERNANALDRLVADLLDISRIITGKVRINPSQVDVSNIVDMAVEGVRPAAEAKRLLVHVDIAREGTLIRADGDRLQQVAWSLLANAVKFTPKNGEIHVSLRPVESDIELRVQDNGAGIDAAFLPHIFESFRQSDSSTSRAHSGLGVGLSLAKHIVELHGGTIQAHSAGAGKGATFIVRVPVSPLVSATLGVSKVRATTDPPPRSPPPAGLEGIRVLVVDDEADARELVGYVLENCGMVVRLAGSVAEALAALADFTPEVVISDIGMPEQDGYFLIRAIRALPSHEHSMVPAIALTAFARNEDRTRALVEGFNRHIAKPVEPAELVQAVAELAGRLREAGSIRPP